MANGAVGIFPCSHIDHVSTSPGQTPRDTPPSRRTFVPSRTPRAAAAASPRWDYTPDWKAGTDV